MIQSFWVPGPLPSLNDLLRAKGNMVGGKGKRWNGYNAMKKTWETTIWAICKRDRIQPMQRVRVVFQWHERTMRRDPDNVGAARKLILDALVCAGVLVNDGPKEIAGFAETFVYGAPVAGVQVTLEAVS
ncbi:MAG TPA: hypothetical protein VEA41_02220, partial [Salinarimonas sp.]|nr:hypothetical protein [Salinarimonas sp.]